MSLMKLNPECRRSFMENFLDLIIKGEKDSSKFLNCLTISKSFLICSRQFSIYRLDLKNDQDFEEEVWPALCFVAPTSYSESPESPFMMPHDEIEKLIEFLKPQFFALHADENTTYQDFKEQEKLLAKATGKIGFFIKEESNEGRFVRRLFLLPHKSLKALKCDAEHLTYPKLIPDLDLNYLHVTDLRDISQLKDVLRHKMKVLQIDTNNQDFLEGPIESSINGNQSKAKFVEDLTLNLDIELDDFVPVVKKIVRTFPKLKSLTINTNFIDEESAQDFNPAFIAHLTKHYYDTIGILRKKYSKSKKLKLKVNVAVEFITCMCQFDPISFILHLLLEKVDVQKTKPRFEDDTDCYKAKNFIFELKVDKPSFSSNFKLAVHCGRCGRDEDTDEGGSETSDDDAKKQDTNVDEID